jgi:16S rRNA (guanine527-N7)-methyltransferase
MGATLDARARHAIEGHVRLLLAWTDAINLTAIRDPAEVAVRHVLDSLTAVPILTARGARRVVDLGSGGGDPGLPLAAGAGLERVGLDESVARMAGFLEKVVAEKGLDRRVEVLALRAEALAVDRARTGWDAVTARAVAPLAELVELAFPLLAPGGSQIAWKSATALEGVDSEVPATHRAIATIDPGARIEIARAVASPVPPPVAALADHRLAVVTRTDRPITGRWPREPAARRRQPW